jgi:hypothetical protein
MVQKSRLKGVKIMFFNLPGDDEDIDSWMKDRGKQAKAFFHPELVEEILGFTQWANENLFDDQAKNEMAWGFAMLMMGADPSKILATIYAMGAYRYKLFIETNSEELSVFEENLDLDESED